MPYSSAAAAGFNSCLTDVGGFFTNNDNHLARYARSSEGRDKACKFAVPFFETVGEIHKACGAPKDDVEAFGIVVSGVKIARDVHGTFNIFAGVIPSIVFHAENCKLLIDGLRTGNDVILKKAKEKGQDGKMHPVKEMKPDGTYVYKPAAGYNSIAKGTTEKILALISNIFQLIASLAYAIGFGICRPIANLDKYLRDKNGRELIHMSEGAKQLGQAFSTVMMFNHLGAFVGSGCEIAYQYEAFNRACEDVLKGKKGINLEKDYATLNKEVVRNVVGMVEKFFEMILDIVHLIGEKVPAWFRLPVSLAIGVFAVWKKWLKTAPEAH